MFVEVGKTPKSGDAYSSKHITTKDIFLKFKSKKEMFNKEKILKQNVSFNLKQCAASYSLWTYDLKNL